MYNINKKQRCTHEPLSIILKVNLADAQEEAMRWWKSFVSNGHLPKWQHFFPPIVVVLDISRIQRSETRMNAVDKRLERPPSSWLFVASHNEDGGVMLVTDLAKTKLHSFFNQNERKMTTFSMTSSWFLDIKSILRSMIRASAGDKRRKRSPWSWLLVVSNNEDDGVMFVTDTDHHQIMFVFLSPYREKLFSR